MAVSWEFAWYLMLPLGVNGLNYEIIWHTSFPSVTPFSFPSNRKEVIYLSRSRDCDIENAAKQRKQLINRLKRATTVNTGTRAVALPSDGGLKSYRKISAWMCILIRINLIKFAISSARKKYCASIILWSQKTAIWTF